MRRTPRGLATLLALGAVTVGPVLLAGPAEAYTVNQASTSLVQVTLNETELDSAAVNRASAYVICQSVMNSLAALWVVFPPVNLYGCIDDVQRCARTWVDVWWNDGDPVRKLRLTWYHSPNDLLSSNVLCDGVR